jgi:hypothetical protein
MTTEKSLNENSINIVVIHADANCDFYDNPGLGHFPASLRKLMLMREISSYEMLCERLDGKISIDRARAFFLENEIPTDEEFTLLSSLFDISPSSFLEFRQRQQRSANNPDEIRKILVSDESSSDEVDKMLEEIPAEKMAKSLDDALGD